MLGNHRATGAALKAAARPAASALRATGWRVFLLCLAFANCQAALAAELPAEPDSAAQGVCALSPAQPPAHGPSKPPVLAPGESLIQPDVLTVLHGRASWYAPRFQGRRTASGERYDQRAFTAAHRSLPFGTWVLVRSLQSGKEVQVRINDRGPQHRRRVIDLSQAAAVALGIADSGVHEVTVLVLASPPEGERLGY